MEVTQVTVTIRNPAEPERSWEGLFLHEEELSGAEGTAQDAAA